MTATDVQNFENIAVVVIFSIGVLCGAWLGQAFSFWKW